MKITASLVSAVQSNLTPDLLKPEYRKLNQENPMFGHCYVASEALFHLAGGKTSGLKIKRGRDDSGIVHWWLEDDSGRIIDATADQYRSDRPPYEKGKSAGFLTKNASKRAKLLIERVGDYEKQI